MKLSVSIIFFIISSGISLGVLTSESADRFIYSSNQSEEKLQTPSFISKEDTQPDTGTIALLFTGHFQSFTLRNSLRTTVSATSIIFSFIKSRAPPA